MSQNSTSVSAKASIFQIFSTCCSTSGLRIMQNNGLSARVHHRDRQGTGSCHHPLWNPNTATHLLFTMKMLNGRAQLTVHKSNRLGSLGDKWMFFN